MDKKRRSYYRGLYLTGALYDFLLGIAFIFFYVTIFGMLGMNLPKNSAYLTFCAVMIALFGVLQYMIFLKLEGSRRLIVYSILVKIAYVGTVFYYYFLVGPDYVDLPFIIFAGFDIIFAILFAESLRFIKE